MPLDTPFRTRSPKQTVAFVHVVTPRNEMQRVIPEALHELTAALRSQSIQPTGPWLAHHHRPPTDTFDFDACFPIDEPLASSGRVQNGEIAEADVIRATFRGNYDALPQAWLMFRRWIAENGFTTRGDAWEVYKVGPQGGRAPEEWETELNYPLAD